MNNFRRALKLALRNWLSLLGAVSCSVMVALLWGANIGTVYPVVEVVFQGKSLHEWVDARIQDAHKNAAEISAEIKHLQEQLKGSDPAKRRRLEDMIALRRTRLEAEQQTARTAAWLRPHIRRFLPDDPFLTLVAIVACLFGGTVLKGAFLMGNAVLIQRVGQQTALDLRKHLLRHLLKMEVSVFGEKKSGDLMSRISNDTTVVAGGVVTLFGKTLTEPLKMAACIVGAAFVSWRLLLFSLIVCPLAIFLMVRLAKSIKRANRRAFEEAGQMLNRLFQILTAIEIVKAFNMEGYERSRFHQAGRGYFRKAMKIATYGSLIRVNNEVLGIGVACLSILAGGYLLLNQETHLLGIRMTDTPMSLGALLAFYAFLIGVNDPIRKLSDVYNSLQAAAAAADRVYLLLDREPAIQEPRRPKPLPDGRRDLLFDRVYFHYEPGTAVLKNVSLQIPFGQSLAVVGPNGCGKTTLLKLILRFYDPVGGAVRFGDTDLRRVRSRDLRKHIGLVTQQAQLFDDTIMNNIRYGSPSASEEEIIAAAKRAHAHEFIEARERGYQTRVGTSGVCLTGGQQQRIALARAVLRDPPLLLLDEATSQIDPESERLIQESLRRFIRGRTTIMITHRFSMLGLADAVAVMDRGEIVDIGTQAELLGRCPLFRTLYQSSLRKSA